MIYTAGYIYIISSMIFWSLFPEDHGEIKGLYNIPPGNAVVPFTASDWVLIFLPEGEATPPKGQGVVPGRLSSLVICLVTPELVAGLTVAQVVLSIFVKIAILQTKEKTNVRIVKWC